MKSIMIVYGTSNRDMYSLCQKVAQGLQKRDTLVQIQSCEITIKREIDFCDCVIFAAQSFGSEGLDIMMERFLGKLEKINLQKKPAAVIALEDGKYTIKGNGPSERICTEFFEKHNAEIVIDPLIVMKNSLIPEESVFEDWGEKLIHNLKENVFTKK